MAQCARCTLKPFFCVEKYWIIIPFSKRMSERQKQNNKNTPPPLRDPWRPLCFGREARRAVPWLIELTRSDLCTLPLSSHYYPPPATTAAFDWPAHCLDGGRATSDDQSLTMYGQMIMSVQRLARAKIGFSNHNPNIHGNILIYMN